MIINLWSTPRTGSIWYSYYLKHQHQDSILVTELFNRYLMNIYHTELNSGRINTPEYVDGCYYDEYYLLDGMLNKKKKYGPRERNILDEEEYRLKLLMNTDGNARYVLHNHVEPMNPEIKKYLISVSDSDIFNHRRDRRAQLGSYAIAMATKQFAKFNSEPEQDFVIDKTPIESLSGLLKRIRVWDQMEKNGSIIAYEDIEFQSLPGAPQKQVLNYRTRLSETILKWIDDEVSKFESEIT